MASKKKAAKRPRAAQSELKAAKKRGTDLADDVLAFRARQRRRRRASERRLPPEPRRAAAAPLPRIARDLRRSPRSAGVLIAEGDSWFDYPLNDVLRILEDDHLYDVESVAQKGDRVEDMAYSGGQFEEFARRLEKLLRNGKTPKAILLSGGGNDIAGDELAILLNHAASSLPPLNDDIVRGVIDVRLRSAYASIVSGITRIASEYLGAPIPIITHGYAYPVPDGRGFLGGWWFLPGPWLKPGFDRKGHTNVQANTGVVEDLIDRFNDMLVSISADPGFGHVHYLDLRPSLWNDSSRYKQHWANELHPNERGFKIVTAEFARVIATL
jgi:lysophospholipase L1-like esterase